jgi:diguanylate cyclase (GGDEF)-like protein
LDVKWNIQGNLYPFCNLQTEDALAKSSKLVLVVIVILFLGLSLASFIFLILNSKANESQSGSGTWVNLAGLRWYARSGFLPEYSAGFDPSRAGVQSVGHLPLRLNQLFQVPPGSTVNDFTAMTSFELSADQISEPLMLSLSETGQNWAVYLNGEEVRSEIYLDAVGNISLQRSVESILILLPAHLLKSGTNILVFRFLGNAPINGIFSSWLPGFSMSEGYVIGPAAQLTHEDSISNTLSGLLLGIYLFLGINQLFMYIRQRESYLIYFSLFLFTCAAYSFSVSRLAFENILDTAFIFRIMYISIIIWPALIGITLEHFFYTDRPTPRGLQVIIYFSLVLILAIFLAPAPWIDTLVSIAEPVLALSTVYLIWAILQAVRAQIPEADKILAACICIFVLVAWTIIDIQFIRTGIDLIQLIPVFLAIAFSTIFVDHLMDLTADLTESNRELNQIRMNMESQVAGRTEELQQANILLEEKLKEINVLQGNLQELAIHDELTGLYNRHFLKETITREFSRAQRDDTSVSLVMIDIDHFKKFNDTYGHAAGDLILKDLGVTVVSQFRVGDYAFRYGGEEILILLPGATVRSATEHTEGLRRLVEKKVIRYENNPLRITFSAGIAAFPQDGVTLKEVLKVADTNLYQAKAQGRNCVVTSIPTTRHA